MFLLPGWEPAGEDQPQGACPWSTQPWNRFDPSVGLGLVEGFSRLREVSLSGLGVGDFVAGGPCQRTLGGTDAPGGSLWAVSLR